ncbi:50S ribosomal protein L24 [Natranaerobius trueperi]|uniref:Large ribosomal subunit protein uL24 n=1 Tax=Natranaerobius trueperi TaxID=759412 RepID=A0A226C215_9FIRM|nr:50S ribosomal protein L24 [Natranaerobius trueperi]OWZ84479.1 50S ribosomal protein L24 [Natranaerobius trueperi]
MAQAKMHIKTGDTVVVISGKDKGKRGKVLRAFPSESKVLVEGVNLVKKHTRASQDNPQGGIVEQESPVYADKVMLYCSKCQRPVRTAKQDDKNGNKQRICKKCEVKL